MPNARYLIRSRVAPDTGDWLVRTIRIYAGISAPELARRLGVSVTTVYNIEAGQGTSMRTGHALAQHLQKPFDELFEVIPKGRAGDNGNGNRARTAGAGLLA